MAVTTSDGFRLSADYASLRITMYKCPAKTGIADEKLYGARIVDRRTIDLGNTTHAIAGYWGVTLNDG